MGVIGAGLMGGGICMCFIRKGIPVVLKDAKKEWLDNDNITVDWIQRLDAGLATIKKNYDISVSKKKMTPEKAKK